VVAALQKSVATLSVQEERLRSRAQGAEGEIADLRRALVSFKEELQDQSQQRQWEQLREQRREQLQEQLRQQVNSEVLDSVRQELEDVRGRCASLSATVEEQGSLVTLCASANARSMECCQELREEIGKLATPQASTSLVTASLEALNGEHRARLADMGGSMREELAAMREELRAGLSSLGAELRRELSAEAGHRVVLAQTVEAQNNSVVQLEALLSNMVTTLREEIGTLRQEIDELGKRFDEQANDSTFRDMHDARWAGMSDKLELQQSLLLQLESRTQQIGPMMREEHKSKLEDLARELKENHEQHSSNLRLEHSRALEDLATELKEKHDSHSENLRSEIQNASAALAADLDAHKDQLEAHRNEFEVHRDEMKVHRDNHSKALSDLSTGMLENHDTHKNSMQQKMEDLAAELKKAQLEHADNHKEAFKAHAEEVATLKQELTAFAAEKTSLATSSNGDVVSGRLGSARELSARAEFRGLSVREDITTSSNAALVRSNAETAALVKSNAELVVTVNQLKQDLAMLRDAPPVRETTVREISSEPNPELASTVGQLKQELARVQQLHEGTIATVPETLDLLRREVDMLRNLHQESVWPVKQKQDQHEEQLALLPQILEAIKHEVHQLHTSHVEQVALHLGEEFDKVQQDILRDHVAELDAVKSEVTELRSTMSEPRGSPSPARDFEEQHIDTFREALRVEQGKHMEQIARFVDDEFAKRNLCSERMDDFHEKLTIIAKSVGNMVEDLQKSPGRKDENSLAPRQSDEDQLAGISDLAQLLRGELGNLRQELEGSHNAVVASASAALSGRWRLLQEQLTRLMQMAKLQQDMHSQHLASLETLHQRHAVLAKSVLNEEEGTPTPAVPQQELLTACADVMRAMEQCGPLATPRLNEQVALSLPAPPADTAVVPSVQAKEELSVAVAEELQVMRRALDVVRAQVSPDGCWGELRDRHLELSQQVSTLQDMHSYYTQKLYMDLRAVIQELNFAGAIQEVPTPTARAMAFFEELDTPRRQQLGGLSDEVCRLRQAVDDLRDGMTPSNKMPAEALRQAETALGGSSSRAAEGVSDTRGLSMESADPGSPVNEVIHFADTLLAVQAARLQPDAAGAVQAAAGVSVVTERISPEPVPAVSSEESFRPRQLFEDEAWGTADARREVAPMRESGLWNMVSSETIEQPATVEETRNLARIITGNITRASLARTL